MSTYLKLICVMFFWASSFVSGRVLSTHYNPFSIAFLRFFFASIALLPILYYRKANFYKITLTQLLKLLVLGGSGVFAYNYFFFSALGLVEVGTASVIIAINPTITATLAALIFKESMGIQKFLAVFMALFGTVIVITKGDLQSLLLVLGKGEFLLLGAVISWVTYTLFGKYSLKKMTSLEAVTGSSLLGCLMLLPFALKNDLGKILEEASVYHWLHLANLGFLVTALSFVWFYDAIMNIGAARTSSFINMVPIFAVTFGVVFLGESVSISLFIGGAIVISSIALLNLRTSKPDVLSE